eukprot:1101543-Rhodomonas_salina.1
MSTRSRSQRSALEILCGSRKDEGMLPSRFTAVVATICVLTSAVCDDPRSSPPLLKQQKGRSFQGTPAVNAQNTAIDRCIELAAAFPSRRDTPSKRDTGSLTLSREHGKDLFGSRSPLDRKDGEQHEKIVSECTKVDSIVADICALRRGSDVLYGVT